MKTALMPLMAAMACICALACGESAAPNLVFPDDYEWYADSAMGFRIAYPDHWDDNSPQTGSMDEMILGGAHFPALPDSINAQLDITVFDSGYDLEQFRRDYGADEERIAGLTAYGTTRSFMGTMQRMVVFPGEGRYYFVQCVAAPEIFDDYGDIFDDIVGSFELIE